MAQTHIALLTAAVILTSGLSRADPETVDGLLLTKRSDSAALKRRQAPLPAGTPPAPAGAPDGRYVASVGSAQLKPGPQSFGAAFPQAHLGGGGGGGGRWYDSPQPQAFANYLPRRQTHLVRSLEWYSQHPQWQPIAPNVVSRATTRPPSPPPAPPVAQWQGYPRQSMQSYLRGSPTRGGKNRSRLNVRPPTGSPRPPPTSGRPLKQSADTSTVATTTKAQATPTTSIQSIPASTGRAIKQEPSFNSKQAASSASPKDQPSSTTITATSPVSTPLPPTNAEEPRAIPLLQGKRASPTFPDGGDFDGADFGKSLAGVLVGVAFVAVFVAAAIGLAAGRLMRLAGGGGGDDDSECAGAFPGRLSRSSPEDEDRTPPELRGCANGHPSFVQPGEEELGARRGGGGKRRRGDECNGQTFFTGQLILHEARKLVSGVKSPSRAGPGDTSSTATCLLTGDASQHVTSRLAAAQAAVMMPSPAEQVTDDLVSPKYDDEEDDEEDEDSDDTVYECPGLAATGNMVVSNPFFLQGGEHLEEAPSPKPISQSSIFHHGIKGVN